MGILKVFPLMYLVVKASALWLPRSDPMHVTEYNENCVCPTESPTIINSLDSDRAGVERLVVFMYKKPNTGEIISFIPQKEHQKKIPDFPDTYGHIHNIDQNPSIREIFEISPSKDIREHKTHVEPAPQEDSNEDGEHIEANDDKIPKDLNFDEQHSHTELKFPESHMSQDQNIVKPEHIDSHPQHISVENDDKNTGSVINDIELEIPKWQIQTDTNKVMPENYNKLTKNIIDDNGMNVPERPMQHDGIKVNPEHFISYPNTQKNTEIKINDIGTKIPEWPMQLDGIKVNPEQSISYPNDHKNTEIKINDIGTKIPEWPMQLDGIKVIPEHFISYPIDHKNTEIKINDIGTKIPQWPIQLDGIKVKPEHFVSYPNDQKKPEIIIDNIGTKIPQWPIQLDGIKVKPEHFISYPNDHINTEIMIDNIGTKIPQWPMQLDGIEVKPENFISNPNDQKNTEFLIDNIGLKIPKWQMQIDQNKVKPEHFISYPQPIPGKDDHKHTEILIDGSFHIPKWQMKIDENKVKPEPIISYPNDHKKTETVVETNIKIPNLQIDLDQNQVNPVNIISQLVPLGNDHVNTEIVIDDPPKQDISSELIHVSDENMPNSHATVKPLINNVLNVDEPLIESTVMDSLEPQNQFEEHSSQHSLPGGIETFWHKEQESNDEPNHSIHIKPPRIEKFRFWNDKEIKMPTFQRMKVPRKDKYGRIIGWTFKTIKSYWEGGSHRDWTKFGQDRNKALDYRYQYIDDPAFDRWLREQLRITTLNGKRIPTSTADIIALDRAIRNVLLQNGWIVTGEGTLLDGSGKTSSLDNLKLRPILVGKPISYDSFMKQSTHEYTTSSKLPYLEGLLLTMKQPAKILGIVPLSITPQKHHSKNHAEASVHGRSSKAQNNLLRVLPIEELVSFRKDSKSSKTKKPQDSSKNKSKDAELLRQALLEIHQPQYAKGSLTTLKQGKGQVKHRDFGKYGTHRIITPDMPEWRIIGGKSATSSGTPLEWKGRSGLNG